MTPFDWLVAKVLQRYKPGQVPPEIFNQIMKLNKPVAVEVFNVKDVDGNFYVNMVMRSPDDEFWPNQHHIPGSIMRANDTIESTIMRVMNRELGVNIPQEELKFDVVNVCDNEDGRSTILQLIVRTSYGVEGENWFPIESLPEDRIVEQDRAINIVKDYLKK